MASINLRNLAADFSTPTASLSSDHDEGLGARNNQAGIALVNSTRQLGSTVGWFLEFLERNEQRNETLRRSDVKPPDECRFEWPISYFG